MSQEVIKRTQNVLGKYVKKPPLSEKLLGKPPFRYLHDILNVIISDHGFLSGLFEDDELRSDNIKDKEAKVIFLQKVIDATSLALNEPLDVRPSKIVAGHEADKTNLLLQAIAKAVEQKVDSAEAVQKVLSGEGPEKPKKGEAKKATKPKDSRGKEKAGPAKEKRDGSKPRTKKSTKETKEPKSQGATSRGPSTTRKKDKENAPPGASAVPVPDIPDIIPTEDEPKTNESVPPSLRARSGRQRSEIISDEGPVEDLIEDIPESSAMIDDGLVLADDADEVVMGSNTDLMLPRHDTDEVVMGSNTDLMIPPDDSDEVVIASNTDLMIPPDDTDEVVMGSNADLMIPQSEQEDSGTEVAIEHDSDGPNSLLQINTEGQNENDISQSEIISSNNIPQDIDPAILKAMNRDAEMLHPNQLEDGPNPSDSGVGSLESPKHSTKAESLPAEAQPKPDSPPIPHPKTPGPNASRPLSAYHPDLKEKDIIPNSMVDSDSLQEERPKTGMGMRPRTGRKSARPPSARPAPPKVRDKKGMPEEEVARPPTSKPIANVIMDNEKTEIGVDDDDDNFTVGNVETVLDDDLPARLETLDPTLEKNKQELLEGDQDAKGILVAQILETKQELEDNRKEAFSPETPGHRRVPIEQSFAGDASKRKEKELIQKDVEKLTSSIQALTRSVNPLAKMLDYLQEDLDSMQKELENWQDENKVLSQNLRAEQSLTEQQLEPLKAQLEEMESAIFDQQDRISAVKSNILRNDEKVSKLLAGINLNS